MIVCLQPPTARRRSANAPILDGCEEQGAKISRGIRTHCHEIPREPSAKNGASSFRESVALLLEHQLPSGELPLFVSEKADECPTRYVKTVFLTAFQAALHSDIPDPDVHLVRQRSLHFLRQERSPDGLWRFFGRESSIDADIDDTFAALAAFRNDPAVMASLPYMLRRLHGLREESGMYRTWFTRADSRCDLTVNANLLMFLSLLNADYGLRKALHSAVVKALRLGELPISRYYLSPETMLFALRNARPGNSSRPAFVPQCPTTLSDPSIWFVQNATGLFYGTQALSLIRTLCDCAQPETLPSRNGVAQ